ncbi:hypothetical protein P691DRAFT_810320 [Macrolepiota fuliginosa MF-IS2]|uniref:Nephrocystin 3-like N-terminal domain-containing protein n=1 Tax=Macrolepiota fuliginosa MF-IS2 TaxID=1400762 RepID=A0A9P5X1N4_9AGAR|nr:hypothetical protein P691DRAFT_810320 [Macrolepiota fuliginosa MF-IS2]
MSVLSKDTPINKATPARQSLRTRIKRKGAKRKTSIHDFSINNLTQVEATNNTQINVSNGGSKGSGLRILLEKSIPGASHDSSDRYPPPRCHPGTRTQYIQMLTTWGHNTNSHPERIAWLNSLAAVGKSAIAQTCAETLGDRLGAAFFFSRPNHRDKPNRFFTSISYQLAVKYDSFSDIVDSNIIRNPTLVDKALPHQFQDLIVAPIQKLKRKGEELPELVIIVDGLDECADVGAQEDIVRIIAQSAQKQSTPFLWIFLSRPELHLVGVFNSAEVKAITLPIELHISREVDGEIAMFLTDKFRETARKHPQLPSPWPSEEEVWLIVDLSDGRFACADAVSRFIGDDDSAGPQEQLHDILHLAREYSAQENRGRSLTGLDGFYTLMMERVPPKQLQTVLWILLLTRTNIINVEAQTIANALELSESQFRNACRSLHSVMAITRPPPPQRHSGVTITINNPPRLGFYHASFMDFLGDPARSKRFCIWLDWPVTLLAGLIPRFNRVQVNHANDKYIAGLTSIWDRYLPNYNYDYVGCAFLDLLVLVDVGDQRLKALNDFDFRKASFGRGWSTHTRTIPQESELIRRATIKNTFWSGWWGVWFELLRGRVHVVGHGKKKALLISNRHELHARPYSKRGNKELLAQIHKESPGIWRVDS